MNNQLLMEVHPY